MSFAWPWMLLLGAAPIAGFLLDVFGAGPGEDRGRFPAIVRAEAAGGRVRLAKGRRWPRWAFWAALLLIVAALARPQWGEARDQAAARPDVVIALDLSNSMLAADVYPSRIERARAIALSFVDQVPAANIGLIGFAGQAYQIAPPSLDRALLRTFLPAVRPEQMAIPGTNFDSLFKVALRAFPSDGAAHVVVLFSDGEAEPTPWRQDLPLLRAQGVHVVTVGVGAPAGVHIRIGGHELANASDTAVVSRLMAGNLDEIARATAGASVAAGDAARLPGVVATLSEAAAQANEGRNDFRQDHFTEALFAALLLLLWSAAHEWPAVPRLLGANRTRAARAAYAAAATVAALGGQSHGQVLKPPPITLELHGTEPDPLLVVKGIVRNMLTKPHLTAADYMALARAAVRYGEVHRQHAHVLQEGVMRDGLVAIDAGEALDPRMPGWADARAKLVRLLREPRAVNNPGPGAADPANDPIDAKLDDPHPAPGGQPGGGAAKSKSEGAANSRNVGGAQTPRADAAEWQVPSLVKPLYTLQQLQAADRPGDTFRILQAQQASTPRQGVQTW